MLRNLFCNKSRPSTSCSILSIWYTSFTINWKATTDRPWPTNPQQIDISLVYKRKMVFSRTKQTFHGHTALHWQTDNILSFYTTVGMTVHHFSRGPLQANSAKTTRTAVMIASEFSQTVLHTYNYSLEAENAVYRHFAFDRCLSITSFGIKITDFCNKPIQAAKIPAGGSLPTQSQAYGGGWGV